MFWYMEKLKVQWMVVHARTRTRNAIANGVIVNHYATVTCLVDLSNLSCRSITTTLRPLGEWQSWLLEKQKLMQLDHFGSVACIEERTCMGWDLKFSVSYQGQPEEKFFVFDVTALNWMVTPKNSECSILVETRL